MPSARHAATVPRSRASRKRCGAGIAAACSPSPGTTRTEAVAAPPRSIYFFRHDPLRRDRPARCLVAATRCCVPRPRRVRRVFVVGRVPGESLPLRAVPVAVLLAGGVRRDGPQLVRPRAALVAGVAAVVSRVPYSLGAGRLPAYLLLLPRRLLQSLLGRPPQLHRRRAARPLPRRALVSADPPKRAPLFPLPRAAVPRLPVVRRVGGVVVPGQRGGRALRRRRGPAGPRHERGAARWLHPRLPLTAPPRRRVARPARGPAGALRLLYLRQPPQSPPHDVGVDEPVLGGLLGPVRAAVRDRRVDRLENLLVPATEYETHEHDVLVIGAGGAGLRAAIEASALGRRVGVVCKSLLGKAHTVMAEGGIAAALANVDDRDSWRVHFADTMRGGQYLNNWRMAQLHAQESPARVRELEAWGALFDRTPDGRILQRNFGRHAHPPLGPVGERTGLGMIRTLQDHGVHQGIDVHMECTVIRLLKDGERIAGALADERERGRFRLVRAGAVILAPGGVGPAYRITSNSWEYTGDGHALAYEAGADLIDMEYLQFHPTGLVWPPSVQGILVTEAVRGEGGVLRNRDGRRFMFDDIPPLYKNQTADNDDEGWRYTQGDKTARRPPELLTRDHVARCIVRETKEGRGSPHGGVFLDIAWIREKLPGAEAHIKNKLPGMYHQFKQLAGVDITQEPMEVGPTTP